MMGGDTYTSRPHGGITMRLIDGSRFRRSLMMTSSWSSPMALITCSPVF